MAAQFTKKHIMIFFSLIAAISLIGGYLWYRASSPKVPFPEIGSSVQDLIWHDLASGTEVRLSDYKGEKIILIDFWASWCPTCSKEMAQLASVQKEFSGTLVVLGVNRAEPGTVAEKYARDIGVYDAYPLLLDADDTTFKLFKGFAMPTSILVDKKGIIREVKNGPMTAGEMRDLVTNITK